jgi:heat shock protein HslJ
LVDRTWVLQGFLGAATDFGSSGTTPAPPTTAPRLHPLTGSTLFIDTDGNLTATDRCGQFTARVQVFAAKLTIRDRVVSDHSCPAPVGGATDAAALTRRALTGTVAWRIDGDVLEIGPTQGPVLQYGVQTAEPAPSRTGTASAASGLGVPVTGSASPAAGVTLFDRTWYLSALRRATLVGAAGSQPEVQPGDPRRTPTFRIDQHGEFVARSQCFAFVGRAAISPTVLTTHSRSSKALPCSGAIGRQRLVDRLIGRLFAGAVDWRVSGSTLVLTSGRGTAEYTAQPPIPSTGNASTGKSIGGATAAPSK